MSEEEVLALQKVVESEVQAHGVSWCSPRCQTFLPEEYRRKRIIDRATAQQLQHDYDRVHIWR